MKVKEIMHTNPFTIAPSVRCDEAVRMFLEHHVSGAPVVEEGKLVGFLSEKDVFRAMFPDYKDFYLTPESALDYDRMENEARSAAECPVADVMSRRPLTAGPETPVLKVGAHMVATGMHHVPVVEEGKVIGLVSRGDIYRAILQRYFVDKEASK